MNRLSKICLILALALTWAPVHAQRLAPLPVQTPQASSPRAFPSDDEGMGTAPEPAAGEARPRLAPLAPLVSPEPVASEQPLPPAEETFSAPAPEVEVEVEVEAAPAGDAAAVAMPIDEEPVLPDALSSEAPVDAAAPLEAQGDAAAGEAPADAAEMSAEPTEALATAQPDDAATMADAAFSEAHHSPATYDNAVLDPSNRRITTGASGSTGLLHTSSAISGERGIVRLSLLGSFLSAGDFPEDGTDLTHASGKIAIDWVILDFLEAYLSYAIASDFADRPAGSELRQSLGEVELGLKGGYEVIPGLSIGADLRLDLAPGFGAEADGFVVGFTPRLLASWDVRALSSKVPLLVHLNLGATFDNRDGAYDAYAPTAFDEFALGIRRHNRFDLGLGLEVPLPWVTPFLEWSFELPVGTDGLIDREGAEVGAFGSMEHRLSIGVKVTAVRDVTFLLAGDIGLSGEVAQGVPATPPYQLYFGIGYAFDPLESLQKPTTAAAAPASADDAVLLSPEESGSEEASNVEGMDDAEALSEGRFADAEEAPEAEAVEKASNPAPEGLAADSALTPPEKDVPAPAVEAAQGAPEPILPSAGAEELF